MQFQPMAMAMAAYLGGVQAQTVPPNPNPIKNLSVAQGKQKCEAKCYRQMGVADVAGEVRVPPTAPVGAESKDKAVVSAFARLDDVTAAINRLEGAPFVPFVLSSTGGCQGAADAVGQTGLSSESSAGYSTRLSYLSPELNSELWWWCSETGSAPTANGYAEGGFAIWESTILENTGMVVLSKHELHVGEAWQLDINIPAWLPESISGGTGSGSVYSGPTGFEQCTRMRNMVSEEYRLEWSNGEAAVLNSPPYMWAELYLRGRFACQPGAGVFRNREAVFVWPHSLYASATVYGSSTVSNPASEPAAANFKASVSTFAGMAARWTTFLEWFAFDETNSIYSGSTIAIFNAEFGVGNAEVAPSVPPESSAPYPTMQGSNNPLYIEYIDFGSM